MGIDSNQFVKNVALLRDEVESFKKYPVNIDVVKNFKELKFNSQVTFFIGENGTGKSTLIEAIAVALGMPAEGGTNNFMYETKNTTSELSEYLRIGVYRRPKTKFFLRAESFYNFSTEVERLVKEDHFLGTAQFLWRKSSRVLSRRILPSASSK